MDSFYYRQGKLCCEELPLDKLADSVGTPCYVYSKGGLLGSYNELDSAFAGLDHMICFSVKSNSSLALLKLLGERGAGMDIVSSGELYRSLRAGVPAGSIVYSGVGKTDSDIRYALESGILCFNAESLPELEALDRVAGSLGKVAPVSLRINPDVASNTHEYTSTGRKETKFGIPFTAALDCYREIRSYRNLRVFGIDMHIGSQITELEPIVLATERLAELFLRLSEEGIRLEAVDIGGGLGIRYHDETPPSPAEYAKALVPVLKPLGCRLIIEPGRYISGQAGALLTRVIYFKETGVKNFAVVDAGMNDLIRPSLYNSYHRVLPVSEDNKGRAVSMDVVGPICESGDWLAKDRLLPPPEPGDLMAVLSAGAYGFTMSSNYNSRPRGAEVLVDGTGYRVIRRAETLEDLVRGEEL
ncbi:MAG: diaminopimelate decarboxylase [Candidatus Glassbacteria bacterium]|nr:diaminopimelate decarboxylase [Candidatus Glassbacteria bacterium]